MSEEIKSVDVRLEGRVQGVGFRMWTRHEAQALRLTGWVRNEADGSVRAHFHGPATAVEAMLSRIGRGPDGARVDGIEAADADAHDAEERFEIR